MASMNLIHLLRRYLSITISLFRNFISCLFHVFDYPILIKLPDAFLSLYFMIFCDLRPITVDLDDGETTIHFWISGHHKIHRQNLVMLHGYGGNSKWQFIHQVSDLSKSFNLFIPDLVFFGRSYSRNQNRNVDFQAKSIIGGLKRLGCGGDLAVYSISYGGFVAYRMAKMWPEMVKKLVIVSSGVGLTQKQKTAEMKSHGGDVSDILVPRNPSDLRQLVRVSMNNGVSYLHLVPDFILSQFIAVMYETNRQELVGLAKNLMEKEDDTDFSAISQEDEDINDFQNVNTVFGAAKAGTLITKVAVELRGEAARCLKFEAKARISDPVGGVTYLLEAAQRDVDELTTTLTLVELKNQ